MQGTQVQPLIQEDATCLGVTKPMEVTAEPASLHSETGEATAVKSPGARHPGRSNRDPAQAGRNEGI